MKRTLLVAFALLCICAVAFAEEAEKKKDSVRIGVTVRTSFL